MSEPLEFTETEAEREEAIYETPAAANRRRLVRETLDLEPGDAVLSIGCGPGFEPAEMADVVGTGGRVHGIDRSESMLALANRRCDDRPHVELTNADAVDLPVADGTFDAATAVQVFQYVDDVRTAADELHRILRPGGRAVVYDTDFDSLVWRSPNRERMERILEAFDDHCPRPHLGSRLAPTLREAGLTVERVAPNTILDTRLDENTFAFRLMEAIADYARAHDDVAPGEAAAWTDDLSELDDAGGTFFSLTQYLYLVRKEK